MQLLRSEWLSQGLLPGGLSGLLAWLCLVNRFHHRGRLLGSHRSTGLALAVCLAMALAAVAANVCLPGAAASRLRPLAVAAVGTGVAKRRRQQDGATPLASALSLGVARLLVRLEERLEADRADWCDEMLSGLKGVWQRMFIDDVHRHLMARAHHSKPQQKLIEDHYKEACQAFEEALAVTDRIDRERAETAVRIPVPATYHEETRLLRRVNGEADERCKLLLRLAHEYGRRTDDRTLRRFKERYTHGGPYLPVTPVEPPHGQGGFRIVRDRDGRRHSGAGPRG